MADTKATALNAITGADVSTSTDVLTIVDTSATESKKILVDELRTAMGPRLETEQASTSGTSIDFTSIPAWVKKITIHFIGVSTNGTSNPLIQLGDSGGVEATGYVASSARLTDSAPVSVGAFTAGFGVASGLAANALSGLFILSLEDASDNTWAIAGTLCNGSTQALTVSGHKSLSAALDRVRITTLNGTDAFDAGAINLLLE